ncbi:MAG: hypothetical protein ACK49H_03565 [Burkholderiales bacterium]
MFLPNAPTDPQAFQALRVDPLAIDDELTDAGQVGPELAAAAQVYLDTPRALIWRAPSPDWRLFVVLLPLASRLSLLANPVFAQLAREWGLGVRFIGIDAHQAVYDFRGLLTDQTLRRLLDAIGAADDTLDVLFAALADNMLTVLQERRQDWGRHLARELRLESGIADSLFDREARYPDFMALLRQGLRQDWLDQAFYGRVLRAMDLREGRVEARIAQIVQASLHPPVMTRLARNRLGLHLGAYNWLLMAGPQAGQRSHVLSRLPLMAQFFAEALIDAAPRSRSALVEQADGLSEPLSGLRRAIDSGQDRTVIEALSAHFAVDPRVLRALWRQCPRVLGSPPSWQLQPLLLTLDALPERLWPATDAQWLELAAQAWPEI